MIVERQPNESPSEPDFEVTDVLIEGVAAHGWTRVVNFRVDPSDETKVRFEYTSGEPVRVRRDSIIATRGRRPSAAPEEFDRAAIDRLIQADRNRSDAVPTISRADAPDTRPEDFEESS